MKRMRMFPIRIPMVMLALFMAMATSPHAYSPDANLPGFAPSPVGDYEGAAEKTADASARVVKARMPFISNEGQVDEHVKFYARTLGGAVFVTRDGKIFYHLPVYENDGKQAGRGAMEDDGRASLDRNKPNKTSRGVVLQETFMKADVNFVRGEGRSGTRVNYFQGVDKSKWRTNIAAYEVVSLGEVYKGVEVKLRAHGNNVEKLFFVQPGADAGAIRVRIDGADGLNVGHAGGLEVKTALGKVSFTAPAAYQEVDGKRRDIKVAHVIRGNEYGFRVGEYDRTRELVVDPLLASTFLGGALDDVGYTIALNQNGDVYIAGYAYSEAFPTTPGVYSESFNDGLYDVFISKFDSDLTVLLSSTYLGGGDNEKCRSIALDQAGSVYVTGYTSSTDFPTTPGAYDELGKGNDDVFISKLNGDLTTLSASTILGGNSEEYSYAISLDPSGCLYVTGYTYSSDFPTTSGAYDENGNGSYTAFISKLDGDLATLVSSTRLGGGGQDYGFSLSLDQIGNVYVAGCTESTDFPTTSGAYDEYNNGNHDAFVSKLDSSLTTLLASTFLGGNEYDQGNSLVLAPDGSVYVAGATSSSDFPSTNLAYSGSLNGAGSDIFVSRLDGDLNNLLASTFLGGSLHDYGHFLALNADGDVYVTGRTSSSDFPCSSDAYDDSHGWEYDAFASKFSGDLTTLAASTFLGGGSHDSGHSLALGPIGDVYVTGYTYSTDFPTISGAYDESYNGEYDVFVTKLDSELSPHVTPPSIVVLEPDGVADAADVAFTLTWTDESFTHDALVSFYHDTDATGTDGTLIVDSIIEDDETDAFTWDVSALPEGVYYVYAVIDDQIHPPVSDYGDGPVSISHSPHFIPIYTGNPYHGMKFWIVSATADGVDLDLNDRVGVFDGENCVGQGVVRAPISYQNPLIVIASQDDGSGNGFTPGAPIYIKIWDFSAQEEITFITPAYLDITTGDPVSPPVFEGNGDYGLELSGFKTTTLTIPLYDGWNIFSSHVMPEDPDLLHILQPLIDSNALVKANDEAGNDIINVFGDWSNQIGDLDCLEGYEIKVQADCDLVLEGRPAGLPAAIPLTRGWNIMGYPSMTPQNGKNVVQPLIDSGELVQVNDEKGDSIMNVLGVWINQIGDFREGEGYLIKVNANTALTINEASPPADGAPAGDINAGAGDLAASHFSIQWRGNPYRRMRFWVAGVHDGDLSPGDEIGVFDGETCVGAGVVNGPISIENFLMIVTSMEDGDGDGFSEGNPVQFKVWKAGEQREITDIVPEYFDIGDGSPVPPMVFGGNTDVGVYLSIPDSSPVICTDPFGLCDSCQGTFQCHASIQSGIVSIEEGVFTRVLAGPGDYEENIIISGAMVLILHDGSVTLGPAGIE